MWIWVSQYQNISILDFIRAKRTEVVVTIRIAPDIIPGPGRNPAVFSNLAPAGYDRWIYQILKIRTSLLSGLFF